eukprot:6120430-Pyramimonas_sp.AAC.1
MATLLKAIFSHIYYTSAAEISTPSIGLQHPQQPQAPPGRWLLHLSFCLYDQEWSLGWDQTVEPFLSRCTTEEFDSPPKRFKGSTRPISP